MSVDDTTTTSIERLIRELVADELEQGTLPPADTTFTDLGLDSTAVIGLSVAIEDRLGVEVPPEDFYDHPTTQRLAVHVHRQLQA